MNHDLEAVRCPTGVPGLDQILQGGLPLRRLYLIQGEPGVGKTTLALQFLLEGDRLGKSGLYITLSESRDELLEVVQSHGWSLGNLHILELASFAEHLSEEAASTLFYPAEVELKDVSRIIFEEVSRVEPARIVIDSLSELRLLSQSALRYRHQVLGLKQFLSTRNSTTLCLDGLTGVDDLEDRQLESVCHGVISLRRTEANYGPDRLQLAVRKLRGSRFMGGHHDYVIETGGIQVFPRVEASTDNGLDFVQESTSCGISGIDSLLGGGLDRGTSTLIMGPAGAGKSSLAINYAHAAACRGEHVSLFVFDENRALYLAKAKAFGLDLDPFIRNGRVAVHQVNPAGLSPGAFAQLVKEAVVNQGTRLLVIDSLTGYNESIEGGRFLGLQLHELLSYLGQQGVMTIMI
ncbi:MAG TPA: ATPase domain-containing protein, partial [Chthoniobacterales bacterium]